MLFESIDRLGKRTYKAVKWLLTAISGVLTTGFILILET